MKKSRNAPTRGARVTALDRAGAKVLSVNLDQHYRAVERRFPVGDRNDYAQLVAPNGNAGEPIHRWFHLKEAFSSRLLVRVLKDTDLHQRTDLRILDPYAGVGTTLVSAADAICDGELQTATAYGIECNPFLHLVSAAKVGAIQKPPSGLLKLGRKIAASASKPRGDTHPDPPGLSTFQHPDYFDKVELQRLLLLRDAVEEEARVGASADLIALCRMALGAIVEPVSNLRRDGRALRYTPGKTPRTTAVQGFLDKIEQVDQDLPRSRINLRGRVLSGDGRTLSPLDKRHHDFDLILFSPPYPNNIDYTEVYKLENWLLGFIRDDEAFAAQRLKTVYSHPSILRPDPLPSTALAREDNALIARVVDPLIQRLPADRYQEARTRMIRGYALDMFLSLRNSAQRVARGGFVVYIVGNSVHGDGNHGLVIAADLVIAQLANAVGFDVIGIGVARHLRRRSIDSPYLRESVVTMRLSG